MQVGRRSPRAVRAGATLIGLAVLYPPAATAAPVDEPAPTLPAPPPAPATGLIPPLSAIGNVLAQSGSVPAGPLGLPDLSTYAPALLLAQNPVPLAPGDSGALALPSFSAFTPDYLVGQNDEPAAPGAGTPAPGIGPTAEDPGTGRLAFLRRLHEMYEAGLLQGSLLGQRPADSAPPVPPAS